MSKVCTKCGKEKILEEFYKDVRNRDGRGAQCKACRQETVRRWQETNYEKVKTASRRWKDRNPEKVKAYSKRYWAENKEAEYAKVRAYMQANDGERESYYQRLRRDRKRGAKGACSFEQLRARVDFYGSLCWMCGAEADTIDHVIPLARGGTEWPSNLRPACRSCNSSKGSS